MHNYNTDHHFTLEAHLPAQVPITLIEKIIMPKDVWEKAFTPEDREQCKRVFPTLDDLLVLTSPIGGDFGATIASGIYIARFHFTPCIFQITLFAALDEPRKEMSRATSVHTCVPANMARHSPFKGLCITLEKKKGQEVFLPLSFGKKHKNHVYPAISISLSSFATLLCCVEVRSCLVFSPTFSKIFQD